MKKIINNPENVVKEMCEGLEAAYPDIVSLNKKYNIVVRKNLDNGKVSLISGGGSGHEPSHAGFVGKGMLDAAVCGDIFASPSTIQVYNAILAVQSKKGTLLIIKNYTGDRMNFDAAAEMAIADDEIEVERVYVNDDVAIRDSTLTAGRRGVAGTVFVHKITGALAEEGASLKEVKAVAEKVIGNVRSLGFALTSCTVPAMGVPTFDINEGEMEFGVGIHGELGIAREKIATADEIAQKIMGRIIPVLPYRSNDEVSLMINGLGGTPLQELFILNRAVRKILDENSIHVYKTMVGNYMTSIDMAGASVTLLKLDSELKRLLIAPASTPSLKV